MPVQQFQVRFVGRIGDAPVFLQHRETPGTAVSAGVLATTEGPSYYAYATAEVVATRTIRVSCRVFGQDGQPFDSTATVEAVYEHPAAVAGDAD
jgi:hypothetical protein